MILKVGVDSLQKVESEFTKIIDSNVGRDEKFRKLFSLMAEGHVETQSMMKEGFVGLAIQNAQLNARLIERNEALEERIKQLQEQFEVVVQELHEQKEKRKNRKRLSKRQPITNDIYNFLIENSKKLSYNTSYRDSRLRLALALLVVTGIRVSELLPLKWDKCKLFLLSIG